MATGRIIHKALHTNEQLSELSIEVRYFYISLIVHADDDGRLRAGAKHLKGLLFPFDYSIRIETIEDWLGQLANLGLIQLYVCDERRFLVHPNWKNWQKIRKDRYKASDCPDPSSGQPLVHQREQNLTQPNLTKPNNPLREQSSEGYSKVFKDKASQAKKRNFNIYVLINKFYKTSKLRERLPEDVLIGILDRFLVKGHQLAGDPWPYFTRALEEESRKHFAKESQKEGEPYKSTDPARIDPQEALRNLRGPAHFLGSG